MNTNPSGNTVIRGLEEASSESNGEFERFEAVLSGLVKAPKAQGAEQRDGSHERPVTPA
jgi:hypothetical protein